MPPSRPTSRTIVLADDSPTQLEYVTGILEDAGFTVIQAEDGQQGFQAALQHRPDLILTDIEMPNLDGYGFCERVQSTAELAETPVVLISSLQDMGAVRRGLQVGARDFLSKQEVDADAILAAIEGNLPHSEREISFEEDTALPADATDEAVQYTWKIFDFVAFGVAGVNLRRQLIYVNSEGRRFFRLGPSQNPGEADRGLLEAVTEAGLRTMDMNEARFFHPFPRLEAHPGVGTGWRIRMEKVLDATQDVGGLMVYLKSS